MLFSCLETTVYANLIIKKGVGEKMLKATRKLSTSGKYSKVLVIPRKFLRILKWREDQKLEITLDEKRKRLVVKDAKN